MTKRTPWEYMCITVNTHAGWETDLDRLGREGWEAFSTRDAGYRSHEIFLKRPIEEEKIND